MYWKLKENKKKEGTISHSKEAEGLLYTFFISIYSTSDMVEYADLLVWYQTQVSISILICNCVRNQAITHTNLKQV